MVKLLLCISQNGINLKLLCLWFRRPMRGFPNWVRWRPGMSLAAGKRRRAAPQTVMTKMGVKPQETVKVRPVSNSCPLPHATLVSKSPTSFIVNSSHDVQAKIIYSITVSIILC